MAVVLSIMKGYFLVVIAIMLIYAVRHAIFSYVRMFGRQRMFYSDINDSNMPFISILVPMHNEESVLGFALDALLACEYDRDRMEIIPINDHSTDNTAKLLDEYGSRHPVIRPFHRLDPNQERGKSVGLNDAMQVAKGNIIIVFDADYRPSKELLRHLALAFKDPEVGAVMGRVIPYNTDTNTLTRLLNLERSGGYQADQQARYTLRTIPQYGGTVGGFRKDIMLSLGGFNTRILAEDTELTFRMYTHGYKVMYANGAECYEEAPETWKVRGRQVRRWSRGHNNVMFRMFFPVLLSRHMSFREKLDGILLLMIYTIPFLLSLGLIDTVALFFLGEMNILSGWWVILFVGAYNSFGNFAPFYEIGTALLVDGIKKDVKLLPLITFSFYFYLWNISLGFLDAIPDLLTTRKVHWAKTERFTKAKKTAEGE